jgi:hypothetical protein
VWKIYGSRFVVLTKRKEKKIGKFFEREKLLQLFHFDARDAAKGKVGDELESLTQIGS